MQSPGGTYFFTVVTFRRRAFLCEPDALGLLRTALETVRIKRPFTIEAMVVLPAHLHCIWTLPPDDSDYPTRWNGIKKYFTDHCPAAYKPPPSAAQRRKRAQSVWQPRYWEHHIRDADDFARHCDYIHWNPVKHRLVAQPEAWPYSSFHRFVRLGLYPPNWGGIADDGGTGGGYGE
jgi:putative transposase